MNIAENTADTAQQAANVVQADVQNQVTQSVTTLDHLKDFLLNHGPDVIYAIIIFIVGRYVARVFKNLAVRMMTHANYDHTVITFVSQLIYYAIMALVLLSALNKPVSRRIPSWPRSAPLAWLSAWPCRAICRISLPAF